MNNEEKIVNSIKKVIKDTYNIEDDSIVMVEIPKDNTNGDYSTNIAMRLTKILKKNPHEIAETLKEKLLQDLEDVKDINIAGPGFINFWLKKDAMADIINTIIDANEKYGHSEGDTALIKFAGILTDTVRSSAAAAQRRGKKEIFSVFVQKDLIISQDATIMN